MRFYYNYKQKIVKKKIGWCSEFPTYCRSCTALPLIYSSIKPPSTGYIHEYECPLKWVHVDSISHVSQHANINYTVVFEVRPINRRFQNERHVFEGLTNKDSVSFDRIVDTVIDICKTESQKRTIAILPVNLEFDRSSPVLDVKPKYAWQSVSEPRADE